MPIPHDTDGNVITKPKTKSSVQKPKMWSVMFVNDDFTPVEFVVLVVVKFLNMELDDATRFTLKVHEEGRASAGRFTKDVADTKAAHIVKYARENGHPLVAESVEAD